MLVLCPGGPPTLRLTARHPDVWNPSGAVGRDHATMAEASEKLDEACAAIGRDPSEIRRSVQLPFGGEPEEFVERIGRVYEAGFSEVVVMLTGGGMTTAADPVGVADTVAEKVLPGLRALA